MRAEFFATLRAVAATDLTGAGSFGETGTEKERVAGMIHEASSRKAGPFVIVATVQRCPSSS
jgi:DNA-binding NtrC family response regulator